MAIQNSIRTLIFEDGRRPYNNKDFRSIQDQAQAAQQIFNNLTNANGENAFIVSGCLNPGDSGIVWLKGQLRYVPAFAGTIPTNADVTLYIEAIDVDETRIYGATEETPAEEKLAFHVHQAYWRTTEPEGIEGQDFFRFFFVQNEVSFDFDLFNRLNGSFDFQNNVGVSGNINSVHLFQNDITSAVGFNLFHFDGANFIKKTDGTSNSGGFVGFDKPNKVLRIRAFGDNNPGTQDHMFDQNSFQRFEGINVSPTQVSLWEDPNSASEFSDYKFIVNGQTLIRSQLMVYRHIDAYSPYPSGTENALFLGWNTPNIVVGANTNVSNTTNLNSGHITNLANSSDNWKIFFTDKSYFHTAVRMNSTLSVASSVTAPNLTYNAGSNNSVRVDDNRAKNWATFERNPGVFFDFKSNSTDGLNNGGTYHGVLHFQPWGDFSGGPSHQMGFTHAGNIYYRHASGTNLNSWSSWYNVWTTKHFSYGTFTSRLNLQGTDAGMWIDAGDTDWFIGRDGTNLRFYYGENKFTFTPQGTLQIKGHQIGTVPQNAIHLTRGGLLMDNGYLAVNGTGSSYFESSVRIGGTLNFALGQARIFRESAGELTIQTQDSKDIKFVYGADHTVPANIKMRIKSYGIYVDDDIVITGNGLKPGGGSWTSSSDARIKENVEDLTDSLDTIMKIRPRRFNWVNKDQHQNEPNVGFVAQELEQVNKNWVSETQQVDQSDLDLVDGQKVKTITLTNDVYAYIIGAIQEQQKQIEALQKEIENLKS